MKEPLFRKVNTRTRRVRHDQGGDFRHQRNTKSEQSLDLTRGPMRSNNRRGLDYTPLFRYLLSKVGEDWDEVCGEAAGRLDQTEPIFWMVATQESDKKDYVRVDESTYYSGLYVDADNRLRVVNPELGPETMEPSCACCTHTFNGRRLTRKYQHRCSPGCARHE